MAIGHVLAGLAGFAVGAARRPTGTPGRPTNSPGAQPYDLQQALAFLADDAWAKYKYVKYNLGKDAAAESWEQIAELAALGLHALQVGNLQYAKKLYHQAYMLQAQLSGSD